MALPVQVAHARAAHLASHIGFLTRVRALALGDMSVSVEQEAVPFAEATALVKRHAYLEGQPDDRQGDLPAVVEARRNSAHALAPIRRRFEDARQVVAIAEARAASLGADLRPPYGHPDASVRAPLPMAAAS
jgi:hypothetical protein